MSTLHYAISISEVEVTIVGYTAVFLARQFALAYSSPKYFKWQVYNLQ